jgi:hypothetical protein
VLNDIVINRRSSIVECGGGISTFYIARQLAAQGGHLYTIDHDAAWVEMLSGLLRKEGLDAHATVVHAPMEACQYALEGNQWYASAPIERALDGSHIGLLLVDGPLAYTSETRMARYPAVPYFRPRLSDDCTVILDDIHRSGEREIARRWSRELGAPFQLRRLEGGIAVACRKPFFNI